MILTPGLNLLQFSKMQQYLPFSSHTNTHSDSHTDAVILWTINHGLTSKGMK